MIPFVARPRTAVSHTPRLPALALLLSALLWPLAAALARAPPPDLTADQVTFVSNVTAIRNAGDGSNRLFIVQQPGVIQVFFPDTGALSPVPFLDISTLVDDMGLEQGLLGLAFHPDYRNNGFFFVNYTRDPGPGLDRTVIARFQVSEDNPDVANPASIETVLEIEQDFSNNNGGDIHFGPDGFLYIGMGDGGGSNDPGNRSQTSEELLGKMLRIDVDPVLDLGRSFPPGPRARGGLGTCGLIDNYGIPIDNPFVGDSSTCAEIWAFGLRNPWRFSFDRQTGDLLIGDVGHTGLEEVNFQPTASPGGENYGWSCKEGTSTVNFNPCLSGTLTGPILEYNHGLGCSITGGFRYRGSIPDLRGQYVYADYCSGRIWFADDSGGSWVSHLWTVNLTLISTFGEDEFGELYIGRQSGQIYNLRPSERAQPNLSIAQIMPAARSSSTRWDNARTARATPAHRDSFPPPTPPGAIGWLQSPTSWLAPLPRCHLSTQGKRWIIPSSSTTMAPIKLAA